MASLEPAKYIYIDRLGRWVNENQTGLVHNRPYSVLRNQILRNEEPWYPPAGEEGLLYEDVISEQKWLNENLAKNAQDWQANPRSTWKSVPRTYTAMQNATPQMYMSMQNMPQSATPTVQQPEVMAIQNNPQYQPYNIPEIQTAGPLFDALSWVYNRLF